MCIRDSLNCGFHLLRLQQHAHFSALARLSVHCFRPSGVSYNTTGKALASSRPAPSAVAFAGLCQWDVLVQITPSLDCTLTGTYNILFTINLSLIHIYVSCSLARFLDEKQSLGSVMQAVPSFESPMRWKMEEKAKALGKFFQPPRPKKFDGYEDIL